MLNKLFRIALLLVTINYSHFSCCSVKKDLKKTESTNTLNKNILPGASRISVYLPYLKNKRVALLVNQTSVVGNRHLVDTLKSLDVDIKKIFSAEHGFRGKADAGEAVKSEFDSTTGIPIVSLYGSKKKPSKESLADVDIVIFDIQDIGVRFFTYISSMHYLMEACAENDKELLVLDRPNPNGFYIDGPLLDKKQKSFVGMHPIPIVHGLTVGELALMINGEKWLDSGKICQLKVINIEGYSHKDKISIPIKPSPNLPNDLSISLYPSLGLFEGTNISVGRGTEYPFLVLGGPDKKYGSFSFTPRSIPGMAKDPMYLGVPCYGKDLRNETPTTFTLKYIIQFYNKSVEKEKFFNNFFNKLAGNDTLKTQILSGLSEPQIKESWTNELREYKLKRKKYLLYEDFE